MSSVNVMSLSSISETVISQNIHISIDENDSMWPVKKDVSSNQILSLLLWMLL